MERLDWPSLHLKESIEVTFFFALVGGLEHGDLLLFTSVDVVQLRHGRQLFCKIPKLWDPFSYIVDAPSMEDCGASFVFVSESDIENVEDPCAWSENLGVTDALMDPF